jgi:hypothetical protein
MRTALAVLMPIAALVGFGAALGGIGAVAIAIVVAWLWFVGVAALYGYVSERAEERERQERREWYQGGGEAPRGVRFAAHGSAPRDGVSSQE